jgi:hypothetical protein
MICSKEDKMVTAIDTVFQQLYFHVKLIQQIYPTQANTTNIQVYLNFLGY